MKFDKAFAAHLAGKKIRISSWSPKNHCWSGESNLMAVDLNSDQWEVVGEMSDKTEIPDLIPSDQLPSGIPGPTGKTLAEIIRRVSALEANMLIERAAGTEGERALKELEMVGRRLDNQLTMIQKLEAAPKTATESDQIKAILANQNMDSKRINAMEAKVKNVESAAKTNLDALAERTALQFTKDHDRISKLEEGEFNEFKISSVV